jgi:beta-lactamase superfamily II metal-dependent hydrolase
VEHSKQPGYFACLLYYVSYITDKGNSDNNFVSRSVVMKKNFESIRNIKTAFFVVFPILLFTTLVNSAAAFTPSGLLEIHYINVGWGTSVLVIGPDGTTLLMDGGRAGMGTSKVIPYMRSLGLLPADGLDYTMSSHLHTDHICGLTEVISGGYNVRIRNYYNGSTNSNSYVTAYRNAANTTTAGALVALNLGDTISLGDSCFGVCYAANGYVWGRGLIPGSQSDENDRSIALLIKYHDFEYIYAGDLGGGDTDNWCTNRSTDQVDLETPVAQTMMPGGTHPILSSYGVEVLHVNHHGSESSMNSNYMNLLTPKFGCIATGYGQDASYMFPRHDIVDNVLLGGGSCITAPDAIVLQSEEGNPAGSLTSYSGYCVGNFWFKTTGRNTYLVDGDGHVTGGPDERAALGMPLTVPMDEPPPAPNVTLIAPNGGEDWIIGSTYNIVWAAVDSASIDSFAIDYSTNMGIEWLPIQPKTHGNPQTFQWTIPDNPSPDCVGRIRVWNTADVVGFDVSDSNFAIITAPACHYYIGDINGDSIVGAADVTYGVRYFKGFGPQPVDSCFLDSTQSYLYVSGDINGNCEFRGSDISRLVAYLKGVSTLRYCHFFPPTPPLRRIVY